MPPDNLGLYPLSTSKGEPIPFDVIRPLGLLRLSFTDSASSLITLPTNPSTKLILSIYATNDCIIGLDVVAGLPAHGIFTAGLAFIPANTFMNIDHNDAAQLSVVGIRVGGGMLIVVPAIKWQDIRKSAQVERG